MTIKLDANLGIEQKFDSPFGPKFLELILSEPIREKILADLEYRIDID